MEHASFVLFRAWAMLVGTAPAGTYPRSDEPAPAPRPKPVATVESFRVSGHQGGVSTERTSRASGTVTVLSTRIPLAERGLRVKALSSQPHFNPSRGFADTPEVAVFAPSPLHECISIEQTGAPSAIRDHLVVGIVQTTQGAG